MYFTFNCGNIIIKNMYNYIQIFRYTRELQGTMK